MISKSKGVIRHRTDRLMVLNDRSSTMRSLEIWTKQGQTTDRCVWDRVLVLEG